MIQTVLPWTPRLKSFLQNATWNQSTSTKYRWIIEMDKQENVSATVTIKLSDRILVLSYERNLAEIGYTAGTCIEIEEFDTFCQNTTMF